MAHTKLHDPARARIRVFWAQAVYRSQLRMNQKNGLTPVKANCDRLADEAECSERTVRRAIGSFRALGFLALDGDIPRDEFGQFDRKNTYSFTERFCTLVRLPYPDCPSTALSPAAELANGAVYVDLSYKKDLQEISKENTKTHGFDLPDELRQAALEFAILESGIAKLRGLARQAGYQLESIIICARERLRTLGLSRTRAYRYLLSLINKPSDYDARAAQLASSQQQAVADQPAIDRFLTEYDGRVFETPDLRELVAVNAAKRTVFHRAGGKDSACPFNALPHVARQRLPRCPLHLQRVRRIHQSLATSLPTNGDRF
ncbi:hypothetical protein [Noviherbaspirillum aerium]|uniref:hypothetical protein n=1 Tax=Noviherbaspirillum aerium TaxID=2588497 RepID=UPI00124F23AF|nr:hypothetical protein [Noviherbaspirillum aerium]